jgi:predicted enzyme related to lactoylglutathione lyase
MAKHPIVHVEIPANDPKTTGEFYSKVFDWKLELDPAFDYLQFDGQGGPGGAFVQVDENGPTQVKANSLLMYIGTDDIDGDLARIESHGGSVVAPKMEIPGQGWFAIFADPTGNKLGLYTGLNHRSG